ncbi:Fc.00g050290.m01.CDS01 [Cosmosporella sp. VM-42]
MDTKLPARHWGKWDPREKKSSHRTNANGPDEGQDTRASYIQRACSEALHRVKQGNMLVDSDWASPLVAALSAISVMAICLNAAAKKQAAGLEVEDVTVKNEMGEVVGTLPQLLRSKRFHISLQHCCDIGRLAFLDAHKQMNSVRSTLHAMIAEAGSIGFIVELLEDPEDARYNLKPEIVQVRKIASDCLKNTKAITDKFEYWRMVTCHLKQTSLTMSAITTKKRNESQLQWLTAIFREETQIEEKAAAVAQIGLIHNQLQTAQKCATRSELQRLQRELTAERPRAAQNQERPLTDEVISVVEKLSTSLCSLDEAKENLAKTTADLQRLEQEELELKNIMTILNDSIHQLGRLKEQLEPLVLFFHNILVEIERTVKIDLEALLRPITNGTKEGDTPNKVEAVKLGSISKKRILSAALQVQGRFSIIADIASAYVQISNSYIQPSINRIESLSTLSDSEWQVESRKFMLWCGNAVVKIDNVAKITSQNMEENMNKYICMLQERAMHAAEENG